MARLGQLAGHPQPGAVQLQATVQELRLELHGPVEALALLGLRKVMGIARWFMDMSFLEFQHMDNICPKQKYTIYDIYYDDCG